MIAIVRNSDQLVIDISPSVGDKELPENHIEVEIPEGQQVMVGMTCGLNGFYWAKDWHITKLSFDNRWTPQEATLVEYICSQNTMEAATLRAIVKKQTLATYIDLKRTDTRAGVLATLQILEVFDENSVADIQERASQILDTVPGLHEIYRT